MNDKVNSLSFNSIFLLKATYRACAAITDASRDGNKTDSKVGVEKIIKYQSRDRGELWEGGSAKLLIGDLACQRPISYFRVKSIYNRTHS